MAQFTATITKEFEVKYLSVKAGARYWEDATINDVEDEGGELIPFRNGDYWEPLILVDTGIIVNWPRDKEADIHYKVCDDGQYSLLDANMDLIKMIDGYVPKIMCPEKNGYGDYIIMKVGKDGKINNWSVTLDDFE